MVAGSSLGRIEGVAGKQRVLIVVRTFSLDGNDFLL